MHHSWQWLFLLSIKNDLVFAANNLDTAFANGDAEKLLYIGSILKIVGNVVSDLKVRLLLLTSILELMLTHNPNFNRFNIEDSINKQFQLKTSILMYMNDTNIELTTLKKRLKEIYQARSNIAHGNFNELAKMEKATKKRGASGELLESYVIDLYRIIRVVIEVYLRDKAFIDFLKDA
jgi:hypothetical protein